MPIDPMEQLLRETMAEFWRQNNLGQKYDVIRRALTKASEQQPCPVCHSSEMGTNATVPTE